METSSIAKEILEAIIWEIATKPGNIITFKEDFNLIGIKGHQVVVEKLEIDRSTNAFRIKGLGRDTPSFKSVQELADVLDLDFMARQHNISFPDTSIPCLFYESYGKSTVYCNVINSIRKDGKVYYEDVKTGTEFTIHLPAFIQHMKEKTFSFLNQHQYRALDSVKHEAQKVIPPENLDTNGLYDREFTSDFMEALEEAPFFNKSNENNYSPINTTNMSTQTLASTTAQQEQIDKILKDLEFKGFKADFHKENITKAINQNKTEFSLKDQSFSKKADFTLTYSLSAKGYYNLSVLGHHKELGTFAKFPLNNAFPRKDVFENFLEGRAFLTNIDKWKDGQPVGKDSVWLTMKDNPCKSAADANTMWNHTKSYDHKFFSIKEEFFGHAITPEEKKDLEKGRLVTFNDCVDLTTGEIQIVAGIHANPGKQKLNYNKPEPTGQFLDQDKLASLKERIQKKGVEQKPEPEEEKKKVTKKKI